MRERPPAGWARGHGGGQRTWQLLQHGFGVVTQDPAQQHGEEEQPTIRHARRRFGHTSAQALHPLARQRLEQPNRRARVSEWGRGVAGSVGREATNAPRRSWRRPTPGRTYPHPLLLEPPLPVESPPHLVRAGWVRWSARTHVGVCVLWSRGYPAMEQPPPRV